VTSTEEFNGEGELGGQRHRRWGFPNPWPEGPWPALRGGGSGG
jgi:hypothetical protein